MGRVAVAACLCLLVSVACTESSSPATTDAGAGYPCEPLACATLVCCHTDSGDSYCCDAESGYGPMSEQGYCGHEIGCRYPQYVCCYQQDAGEYACQSSEVLHCAMAPFP